MIKNNFFADSIYFPANFLSREEGGNWFYSGRIWHLVTTLFRGILYFSENSAAILYAKYIFRTNAIEILLVTYTSSQIHVTERTPTYQDSRCRDDGPGRAQVIITNFSFGRLGPDEIHYRDDFHFDSKNGRHACMRFTRI